VPEITVHVVGSEKSTHVKVVPMLTDLDWVSKELALLPLTAYNAVIAFPEDVPLM